MDFPFGAVGVSEPALHTGGHPAGIPWVENGLVDAPALIGPIDDPLAFQRDEKFLAWVVMKRCAAAIAALHHGVSYFSFA